MFYFYFRTNPLYQRRTLKSFSTKYQNYTICIWPFMKASRNWLTVGTTEVVKMSAILSKCWPLEPKYMWHFWTIIKKLWKPCIDAQRRILHLQISPGLSNCVVSKVRGRDNLCHWKICSINLWGGSKNIACAYRWEQLWNFKLNFFKLAASLWGKQIFLEPRFVSQFWGVILGSCFALGAFIAIFV